MNGSGFRSIVFDLDGTLIDSYAAIAESLNAARARFGLPAVAHDVVRESVGHGLESLIARFVGPERVDEGVERFRERYGRCYAAGTVPLPGVVGGLARLHAAGVRMGVASNKPARFGRAILETLRMGERFVCIHGPDTVGSTKPDPAMLDRCLADLAADRGSTLYVGDMPLDVESGRRAGLNTWIVATGSAPPETIEALDAPWFRTFTEFVDALLEENRT